LAFTHSSVHLHCGWPMASDAVLPLDHAGGVLSRVRLAQLSGQIKLSISVTAAFPLGHLGAMAGVALSCE
jgi:hypothetical protein